MAVQLTQEMILAAQKNQTKYGVPASITLGQIILESSGKYEGGVSKLAYNAKNLFGVKGKGTAGTYYAVTQEQGKDGMYSTTAGFRKYNNYGESIDDHGRLLASDRYTAKTKNAKTVEEYARAIHAAGYATDANYANKLISVINSNNLKQYDSGNFKPVEGATEYNGESLTLQNTVSGEDVKLDLIGQGVKFICVILLLILAVVLFLKGFGASPPTITGTVNTFKGGTKKNE